MSPDTRVLPVESALPGTSQIGGEDFAIPAIPDTIPVALEVSRLEEIFKGINDKRTIKLLNSLLAIPDTWSNASLFSVYLYEKIIEGSDGVERFPKNPLSTVKSFISLAALNMLDRLAESDDADKIGAIFVERMADEAKTRGWINEESWDDYMRVIKSHFNTKEPYIKEERYAVLPIVATIPAQPDGQKAQDLRDNKEELPTLTGNQLAFYELVEERSKNEGYITTSELAGVLFPGKSDGAQSQGMFTLRKRTNEKIARLYSKEIVTVKLGGRWAYYVRKLGSDETRTYKGVDAEDLLVRVLEDPLHKSGLSPEELGFKLGLTGSEGEIIKQVNAKLIRCQEELQRQGLTLANTERFGSHKGRYIIMPYPEEIKILYGEVAKFRANGCRSEVEFMPDKGPVLYPSPLQTFRTWGDKQLRVYYGVDSCRFPYGAPLSLIGKHSWPDKGGQEADRIADFIISQLNTILSREGTMIVDLEKIVPFLGEPRLAIVPVNEKTLPIIKKLSTQDK